MPLPSKQNGASSASRLSLRKEGVGGAVISALGASFLVNKDHKAKLPVDGKRIQGGVASVPARVRIGAQLELYNIKYNLELFVKLRLERGEVILYHYSQVENSGWKVCDETLDCLVMTDKRFLEIQNHIVKVSIDYKNVVSIDHKQAMGWGDKLVARLTDGSEKTFTVSSPRIAAFFCVELKNIIAGSGSSEIKEAPEDSPDFMAFGKSVLAMMALADDMRLGCANLPAIPLTSRTKQFVTYPRTFLAREAVEWILRYCQTRNIMISVDTGETKRRMTVNDARALWHKKPGMQIMVTQDHVVTLLQQMLNSNIITCVSAKKKAVFENKDDYYRFSDDKLEKSKQQVLNEGDTRAVAAKTFPPLNAPKTPGDILNLSVALLTSMMEALCCCAPMRQADYVIKHEMCAAIRKDERYRASCEATQILTQLSEASLNAMTDRQKFCFFFNMFNMLALHASIELLLDKKVVAEGLFGNEFNLSKTVHYQIGRVTYSLFDIEHKILRPQLQASSFSNAKIAVLGAVGQSKRENKALCAAPSGWLAPMNFALFRGEFQSPRIHPFADPDQLEERLNHCTRDYLFRHIKVTFKPAKQHSGPNLKAKFYVPALFKSQEHEFGSSAVSEFLSWLVPFCPLSLQIHMLNNCDVSRAKLVFLPPNPSFYIDLSHHKGHGKPFGPPLKFALSTPPHEEIWHPYEQAGLESEWLDSINSLAELRAVVLAGKLSKNPLGKVLGSYAQRFRITYDKEGIEADSHPGLTALMEILCGFHVLVCRSKAIEAVEEILPNSTLIGPALQALFPSNPQREEWVELLKKHAFTQLGEVRGLCAAAWQSLELPSALKQGLEPVRAQDEAKQQQEMTELNCLKVLVEGLFAGTFPTIFQWYKRKFEQDEAALNWTRKHYRDTVSLGGLGLEEFFWLTEEAYTNTSSPELRPYSGAIGLVEELCSQARLPNFTPTALIDVLTSLVGQVSGAVTKFWEDAAQQTNTEDKQKTPTKRRNLSADDLVMILAYVFIKADIENFYALCCFASDFMEASQQLPQSALPSARMHYEDQYLGQAGFVLTTVQLSLRFITGKLNEQAREESQGSKSHQSFSEDRFSGYDADRSDLPSPSAASAPMSPANAPMTPANASIPS